MGRASSATVYGYSQAIDLGTVNYRRAPRAYGLRSGSAPSGWYSAGSRSRRKARPVVLDDLGYVVPVADSGEDVPRVTVAPVRDRDSVDWAAMRRMAGFVGNID